MLAGARSGGGATAMMPMNGASGTSTPAANKATLRSRSSRMVGVTRSLSNSGSTPDPGPIPLRP